MSLKKERPLQLEVLVNSHGPHEQVRVREPFCGLQRLGADCRLHRYPFLLPKAVRPHSLVIWQRPRPESWEKQLDILRWIRDRGSLLLIEWDDHPALFPEEIQNALQSISMAPLRLCHGLHTSSDLLAKELRKLQPITYVIPNAIWRVPPLNLDKHLKRKERFRIFIGNQNREHEHKQLASKLREWCLDEKDIQVVVVGDSSLASSLPKESIEEHPLLNYQKYRKVMRSCLIALLPLDDSLPNNCKTPIKWMEAAAESVAVVAGPGLYGDVMVGNSNGLLISNLNELIPQARYLKHNLNQRIAMIYSAYKIVEKSFSLRPLLASRLELYTSIWQQRKELDEILINRFPEVSSGLPFSI